MKLVEYPDFYPAVVMCILILVVLYLIMQPAKHHTSSNKHDTHSQHYEHGNHSQHYEHGNHSQHYERGGARSKNYKAGGEIQQTKTPLFEINQLPDGIELKHHATNHTIKINTNGMETHSIEIPRDAKH